jgi:hypothetical protein
MKKFITAVVAVLMATTAQAHEWTPTYPKFEPSFLDGIVVTNMTLFNKRKDIEYYEISVYDEDWNPVPFASTMKLINVPYLGQETVDIYIREADCDRIEYICTTSKRILEDTQSSGIDSRICSKV